MNMFYEDNTIDRPSSVHISHDDMSVASEITFQSALGDISMDRLVHLMSMDPSRRQRPAIGNEGLCSGARIALSHYYYPRTANATDHQNHQESIRNHPPGMATRRFTEPPASVSDDHINAIIELKLQVANQKEMIGRLTSDLNHALSENKFLLTKTKPAKSLFTMASLAEEKTHSDNSSSSSLHQQYNKLQEDMNRLQKSMDLQRVKMAALEEDNRRLSKERNRLQRQIDRTSCKLTESSESSHSSSSSDPHLHERSDSQDFTATLTECSGLSGCERISPTDLAQPCRHYQPRRAIAVDQSQDELADTSYLPWSKAKRRFSEPVNSHGQKSISPPIHDVDLSARSNENKNGWFSDESESSFISKMIRGRKGTKVVEEEKMQVLRRNKSVPTNALSRSFVHSRNKLAPTTTTLSRSFVQSEKIADVGDFKCIDWGDCVSNDQAEI